MGKKGNWFSALKKAFTSSSKEGLINNTEKKNVKEKKRWGLGTSKHGETNSFIPLYREPSSIEKILGDAERELQRHRSRDDVTPKKVEPIRTHHQEPYLKSHKDTKFEMHHQDPHSRASREPNKNVQQLVVSKQRPHVARNKLVTTQNMARLSAIRIQAAYRGYMARKSYRALKGLVRLQKVMRGQSVKRQTTNTMRCMQLLVKVQAQVRARRLQMMERRNQHQEHQTPQMNDKDMESSFRKWSLTPQGAEAEEDWDDSTLTKEERDARTQRKVEAVIKRERALAYAYSHQLLKVTPKSAHAVLTDIRFGGFPLWWNWLDRQLPHEHHANALTKTPTTPMPKRPVHDMLDVPTPRSSITMLPTPRANRPSNAQSKWHKQQLRDDESLTSCPRFTPVPNYMAPTVSAKAKIRDSSPADCQAKKRFSFSLTQSIGSLRWNKGTFFAPKESVTTITNTTATATATAQRRSGRHRSTSSISGFSVDSTVSLPVGVGRKPFK